MTIKYLKKAIKYPSTDDTKTRTAVQNILNDIEKRREEGIKEITKKFDAATKTIIKAEISNVFIKDSCSFGNVNFLSSFV